jgi:SAM-dependent methyltransferase
MPMLRETALSYEEKALLERLKPSPEDWDYLALKDVGQFVRSVMDACHGRLLDFGCGRSPYRSLFPRCEYLRADLDQSKGADFVVSTEGTVNAPSGSFDVILSTQVAEHVASPAVYFSECFRLLKPDGTLLLTTNGMWEDHAVPHDFQRWTADGLKRDLELAGFPDVHVTRLTCGGRALWQMASHHWSMSLEGPGLLRGVLRKSWRILRPWAHKIADRTTTRLCMVDDPAKLYVGIATVCRKPR